MRDAPQITAEDLLLAAREGCRLDGPSFASANGTHDYSSGFPPPWLMTFQTSMQETTGNTGNFREMASKARHHALRVPQQVPNVAEYNWPQLKRSVLFDALSRMAAEAFESNPSTLSANERLHHRTGLRIFGVEIIPDIEGDSTSLDLTNGDFQFSLRLVCCVVRMPLALSNLKLVTLELSGSALVGVDGAFLRAAGSVRLFHSFSSGPIDFAGAEVHGYFDASEALLQPFGPTPVAMAVGGDQGMLNLSQANIDNEVRLKRVEVWGGLTMRGLNAKRPIVLDEAVLLSPLAVLQRMLFIAIEADGFKPAIKVEDQKIPYQLGVSNNSSTAEDNAVSDDSFSNISLLQYYRTIIDNFEISYLHNIMTHSLKERTSSFRGDGLQCEVFRARYVLSSGRFRIKSAIFHDGLYLQGSSLTSPEFQRANFDHCFNAKCGSAVKKILDYRHKTYRAVVLPVEGNEEVVAFGADAYALDLRDSRLGGSLKIGDLQEGAPDIEKRRTFIDGVVALARANVGGGVIINHVEFLWTFRYTKPPGCTPIDVYIAERERSDHDEMQKCFYGRQYALSARGIVIGDGITLSKSSGLVGIDLENSKIGGDIKFFEKLSGNFDKNDAYGHTHLLSCDGAARDIRGRINIRGAIVGGDCKILFSRFSGPDVRAEHSEISGSLIISSPPDNSGVVSMTSNEYQNQIDEMSYDLRIYREQAAKGVDIFRKYDESLRDIPEIDLSNAKAGFFQYPPPAWPRAGRLRITGFRYRRALAYGPLAPHPFASDNILVNKEADRINLRISICVFSLFFSVTSSSIFASGWISVHSGIGETWSMAFFLFVASVYRFFSRHTSPKLARTQPMAIAWLDLQKVDRNLYKTDLSLKSHLKSIFLFICRSKSNGSTGNIYHSLEPYSIAAQALREEGRWISANLVEGRRLRKREEQLSWRINPVQKLFARLMELLSNYGFSLSRPMLIVGLLIILGSMLAYNANYLKHVEPKSYKVDYGISDSSWDFLSTNNDADHIKNVKYAGNSAGFKPILYSIDVIVPTIDLGQQEDWEISKNSSPFVGILSWIKYDYIFAGMSMVGLGIVGLLLLTISTRIGLLFNRYSE